eukprot:GFYU01011053.1.p2 GENE.GFYU01011053.1~~GFYU01011053.1.p2  ORF type:complete len:556 (+),score=81.30 GFYU01011053.1:218-1885(+)
MSNLNPNAAGFNPNAASFQPMGVASQTQPRPKPNHMGDPVPPPNTAPYSHANNYPRGPPVPFNSQQPYPAPYSVPPPGARPYYPPGGYNVQNQGFNPYGGGHPGPGGFVGPPGMGMMGGVYTPRGPGMRPGMPGGPAPVENRTVENLQKCVGKVYWAQVLEHKDEGVDLDMVVNQLPGQRHWAVKAFMSSDVWSAETKNSDRFKTTKLPRGLRMQVQVVSVDVEKNIVCVDMSEYPRPKITQMYQESDINCKYRYLIVLDFEATCDFGPEPTISDDTSEIVEFPWVVLDTKEMKIVHEEQMFVKPDDINSITNYCTRLTGITQDNCKDALPLKESLEKFTAYLDSLDGDYCLLTDGKWDIQVQLLREAKRKGVELGAPFKHYFDVKERFCACYPWFKFDRRGPFLKNMIESIGAFMEGKHHSGIDDSKSISSVVIHLLRQGVNFNEPTLICHDYQCKDDPTYEDFSVVSNDSLWQCLNPQCAVWNRGTFFKCRFCEYIPPPRDVTCKTCKVLFTFNPPRNIPRYMPTQCHNCANSERWSPFEFQIPEDYIRYYDE